MSFALGRGRGGSFSSNRGIGRGFTFTGGLFRPPSVHSLTAAPQMLSHELEISKYRDEIMQQINLSHVTIISAPTGCGKSTQVPQFILDESAANGNFCNILVSQPRKIAAITVAKRVAVERQCELGGLVGFQVGLCKKMTIENHETRLLYCTTGVILEKLIQNKSMVNYTHVILDEIHEREVDMDLLLILVKEFLLSNSMNTKVILMSATIEADCFKEYFTFELTSRRTLLTPAIINLQTERIFKIKTLFLDHLEDKISEDVDDYKKPGIKLKLYEAAKKIIEDRLKRSSKSILVFLPGIYEIKAMHTILLSSNSKIENSCLICVLHSSLSSTEQQIAFMPSSKPKIVLCTNIAESSITITGPEIDCIIDFCLTKYLVTSSASSMASLQLDWASKTSLSQRAGRTGRTCDGRVYRLIHRQFYERSILPSNVPEMLRCPLESVVLRVKKLDVEPPHLLLQKAIDPPSNSDIIRAVMILKELGGIERRNEDGSFNAFDGKLTYVGAIMAALPLDIKISKLIVLGYMFSVLDEAIIIGAGLNVSSIFRKSYQKNLDDYIHKMAWADGSGCDFIAILNAYKLWKNMSEQRIFKDWKEEKRWCDRFNLERKSLHEMRELIYLIKNRLKELKIESLTGQQLVSWEPREKAMIVQLCVSGAFIPNFFISGQSMETDDFRICKELCDKNPFNTIIFRNMDRNQIGDAYAEQLVKQLVHSRVCQSIKDVKVVFDEGSSKVYAHFINKDSMIDGEEYNEEALTTKYASQLTPCSGRVMPEVYKALKLSSMGFRFALRVMDSSETEQWALEHGYEPKYKPLHFKEVNKYTYKHPGYVVLPTYQTSSLQGLVTHIDHCGKFYIQPISDKNKGGLKFIQDFLNSKELVRFNNVKELKRGQFVIAEHGEDTKRSKVVEVYLESQTVLCFMLDFGNTEKLSINQLYVVTDSIKECFNLSERCFEASLSQITPSFVKCPKGKWTRGSIKIFREIALLRECKVEIYSVVESVAAVKLFVKELCVNEKLIVEKYAQEWEEGFTSQREHDLRKLAQSRKNDLMEPDEEFAGEINNMLVPLIPSPPMSRCNKTVFLKGPTSPLETKARNCEHYSIIVDSHSINSVLLRDDPQNHGGRMLVAAFTTGKGNEVVAHETSLLPDIQGLPVLLAMFFSPEVAFKRSVDNSRYEFIKFGLGYDQNKRSLFSEHDSVLPVNIEIDAEDFKDINTLRTAMSFLLMLQPNELVSSLSDANKFDMLQLIKKKTFKILTKKRITLPTSFATNDTGDWSFAINNENSPKIFIGGGLYQTLTRPDLSKPDTTACKKLINKLDEILHTLVATTSVPSGNVTCWEFKCPLCIETYDDRYALQIHFSSKKHLNLRSKLELSAH